VACIHNNRGIAGGKDLPESFLELLYNNIINDEIKVQGDTVFSQAVKKGWLRKHGRNNRWQKRYFVVSNNCLFYYMSQEDHEPRAIIPLEGLKVDKNNTVKGDAYCFELYDPSQTQIKSVKLVQKDKQVGKHESYILSCESEPERESWISAITNNIVSNPVMQLINQKKLQMEQQEVLHRMQDLVVADK